MRIFCLGGGGRICREAILDLVQFSGAAQIAVADVHEAAGREVVAWLDDPRVGFVKVDVRDRAATVQAMRGYDVVMDGTTIGLNGRSTACIAEAGCHGIKEAIGAYLMQAPEGGQTELYGYALHVEVEGRRGGTRERHTLWHTHPPSDGSVPDWAGLRAYTRNVGIPLAIGAVLLATGRVGRTGVLTPEEAFEPATVLAELRRRGLIIHERIEPC